MFPGRGSGWPRGWPGRESHAMVAQLVARHLAKVKVAGSNPVHRSPSWVTGMAMGHLSKVHPSRPRLVPGAGCWRDTRPTKAGPLGFNSPVPLGRLYTGPLRVTLAVQTLNRTLVGYQRVECAGHGVHAMVAVMQGRNPAAWECGVMAAQELPKLLAWVRFLPFPLVCTGCKPCHPCFD